MGEGYQKLIRGGSKEMKGLLFGVWGLRWWLSLLGSDQPPARMSTCFSVGMNHLQKRISHLIAFLSEMAIGWDIVVVYNNKLASFMNGMFSYTCHSNDKKTIQSP